jgi:hypothetical protein
MMGTVASDAPGQNFSTLGNITAQPRNIFVIYVLNLISAKIALFSFFALFLLQIRFLLFN